MKQAKSPFHFMAASTLTKVSGLKAHTLAEMLEHLRRISADSIFNHTFQSLGVHHYLTEGFSSDFAQWVLAACNAPQLAEQLSALDIRQYESVEALRGDLVRVFEDYVQADPERAAQRGFEPFHFCEAMTVTLPTGLLAHNLEEFCAGLERISLDTLHYHFVTARLRGPATNDFSAWMEDSLELPKLAERVEAIDIYTNTLDGVRQLILKECRRRLEG
ncbi:MAG TPA: DUF5752 family protein [Candidatus Acidoferrales bacterium]|nr:DUF5752 family protein [Candidatus Acidoferrales bacterium]